MFSKMCVCIHTYIHTHTFWEARQRREVLLSHVFPPSLFLGPEASGGSFVAFVVVFLTFFLLLNFLSFLSSVHVLLLGTHMVCISTNCGLSNPLDFMCFSLILSTTMQSKYHHPYFTIKKTEAKRSPELYSGLHN